MDEILTVGRHRLRGWHVSAPLSFPISPTHRLTSVRDVPCSLPSGNTADGRQRAVFHSYVGAACAIGSPRHRLGMVGLRDMEPVIRSAANAGRRSSIPATEVDLSSEPAIRTGA
jgi:hypothetical protein